MKTLTTLIMSCLALGSWAQSECDLTDQVFYPEIVDKWESAFDSTFGITQGPTFFSHAQLQALQLQYPESKIRIYFTMDDTAFNTAPGLVLVTYPVSDCYSDSQGLVLTASNADGPGKLLPLDSVASKMENWRTIMDSEDMQNSFDTIYGYNYPWAHVMEACHFGMYDLQVSFGIFKPNAEIIEKSQIHIYLTSTDPMITRRKYLDFSSPCPKLCGNIVLE